MGTTHLSGLEVAGVPTIGVGGGLPLTTGNYFFVNSVTGNDGNLGTADSPFSTIDYAIGQCTANKGDTIVVMQGHAETLATAGAITCDVAGVNIIGLGTGADRPELTFSAAASSVLVTAANVQIANIVGIAGAACTNPFHLQAAGCTLGNSANGPVEWQDPAAGTQAVRAVLTTTAADNLSIYLRYHGLTSGGTPPVNGIRLVGCAGGTIVTDFYGIASTAWVEFHTTACTDIQVYGYMYNSGTTTFTKDVVDTVTGSTWYANFYDGSAGAQISGGSAAALAADDVSTVNTNLTTLMASTERTIVKTDGAVLSGADALFTVTGGPIMVTNIVGRVTTTIGGAANMTLQGTTTTPVATTAISTTVAVDSDAAGTTWTFTAASPGVLTPVTNGVQVNLAAYKFLMPPGTIEGLGSAAQSGVVEWTMSYLPLSPSAVVAAAA